MKAIFQSFTDYDNSITLCDPVEVVMQIYVNIRGSKTLVEINHPIYDPYYYLYPHSSTAITSIYLFT